MRQYIPTNRHILVKELEVQTDDDHRAKSLGVFFPDEIERNNKVENPFALVKTISSSEDHIKEDDLLVVHSNMIFCVSNLNHAGVSVNVSVVPLSAVIFIIRDECCE